MSGPQPPPPPYQYQATSSNKDPQSTPMPPQPQGYYPAPQHMMAPPPTQYVQQNMNTIVTQTPVVALCFRDCPLSCQCPHCNNRITTTTQYTSGSMVWLVVILLFFVFWPLAFIPFLVDSMKDVDHYCPVCSRKLGTFNRL